MINKEGDKWSKQAEGPYGNGGNQEGGPTVAQRDLKGEEKNRRNEEWSRQENKGRITGERDQHQS